MLVPLKTRFFDRVSPEPNSGCWLWTGNVTGGKYGGYPTLMEGGKNGGKVIYAHRLSYEFRNGPIPPGLQLDHLCRVHCCVNPDHLEPVTFVENIRRGVHSYKMAEILRARTHCPQGHPYAGHNLIVRKSGSRQCRACQNYWSWRVRQRRKANG